MSTPTPPRIILASGSPARKKLLKELGIPFEIHTGNYEEDMRKFKDPKLLATFLASEKAKHVAHKFPKSIIIGADTFGTIDNHIMGKPRTRKEAEQMIAQMSENTVFVHTGLAVIKTDNKGKIDRELISHTSTKLTFARLTPAIIRQIIKKDDVLNVAGALTIEGESGKYVQTIEGDYHNVIGLPLFQLKEMLRELGVQTD